MTNKHPAHSKTIVSPTGPESPSEHDRKKMELGDAMEHEHGQDREETEKDIEELDKSAPKRR
jgi:hypothetical protein